MFRTAVFLTFVFVSVVTVYAGDVRNPGNVGILAQQFNRTTPARNPGGGPAVTEAISQKFFTGAGASDFFGRSVASAGDVNGDGYADLIVGADGNDAGGADAGRAYIYFGGPGMDATADVIFTGAAIADEFGYSVASAGDVNGDGYGDVIVGAYGNDAGGPSAGRAYIYYGGPGMDATADVILTGAAAGDYFGYSVASAGDVNGDGYSDVIVGAWRNNAGGAYSGRAYIYYGGPGADATADVTLTGAAASDYFGFSVGGAGDVNGDGYSDVIVGAYMNDAGASDAGRAYVYYGGPAMDETADVTLTGAAASDYFGCSVAGAGDVNGDGYADLIVGAYGNDAGGSSAGRAYVYYGGPVMDVTADATLTGAAANDYFGLSVAGAGDVNGDGYDDIIVGAYGNDAGGSSAGRAYVYWGGSTVDTTADVTLTGAATGDLFGSCVASAGDVNGDGYSDIIVGAYRYDAGGNDVGRAYLYLNSLVGFDIPDEWFTGAAAGDYLGFSAANAGDVNGDGYDDVIVGAISNDAGGTDAGRAYIYYGGPRMDATPDVTLTGAAAGDYFGTSVASAGDVNRDGYCDVIVGAYGNDVGGSLAGRAYIYYGGPAMDATADVTLTGETANDEFGFCVAGAGDVNGDGYSDVIVGAFHNDAGGTDAGRAYIFVGSSAMSTTPAVTITGQVASALLGECVAGAGDVNGDGYDDVVVGAPWSGYGSAYVYFGGASMNGTADVIWSGESSGDFFGNSVACAGDLDGDGYDDVIVGAPNNDAGGESAGRVYIYRGGPGMRETPDVTLTGAAAGDYFGFSVSGAGDVNGDGYNDFIVGADMYDDCTGAAYIYFGGSGIDTTADVIATGEDSKTFFGYSVSKAGDVNGDGRGDVIVGAYAAGGSQAGRAYVYRSSSPPIIPRIVMVKDLPFDQGGIVSLAWIRSGYDVRNISRVTSYLIERSFPPGTTGFRWEQIANIPAVHNPQYLYSAATPYDSTSDASGTFYFRVTARTANPDEYWQSNIVSGHSVDNLAPLAIGGLSAVPVTTTSVRLSWPPNTHDPDLGAYVVYRSTTNGFVPGGGDQIQALTDTSYLDASLPTAPIVYYRVRARDIHGNLGGLSPQAAIALASTQDYAVGTSWNMISVPMRVDDYTKTVMYPTAISDAFAYSGGYVTRSTLVNGAGYWLKFPSAQGVSMTGFAQVGDTIPVASGWNMVGSIGAGVPVTQITSNPPGLVVSPFYTYSGGYVSAEAIEPHKGYWVKAQQAGELMLSLNGSVQGAVQIVESAEMPPNPPEMVSTGKEEEIPTVFALEQNFPNPFNPTTVVRYQVPVASQVRLVVYDVLGREVRALVDERRAAGYHAVVFDALGLASGTYICRMTAGDGGKEGMFVQTVKLILLR